MLFWRFRMRIRRGFDFPFVFCMSPICSNRTKDCLFCDYAIKYNDPKSSILWSKKLDLIVRRVKQKAFSAYKGTTWQSRRSEKFSSQTCPRHCESHLNKVQALTTARLNNSKARTLHSNHLDERMTPHLSIQDNIPMCQECGRDSSKYPRRLSADQTNDDCNSISMVLLLLLFVMWFTCLGIRRWCQSYLWFMRECDNVTSFDTSHRFASTSASQPLTLPRPLGLVHVGRSS